ncbi:unnamed protein product [Parnassius apollo]|uniref:(apollo) hypothetical protein n=1 Tax=Parnassius apollo TaxID=110799 RepID=A0A8S3WJV1_PARAO|nr:unnamed protein product [Parnassius apollo]
MLFHREQYIFNVFEVIVSTLETKLQRIENLDKAVEHLMRRVEAMDSRVNDNIHKTDAIISKLGNLDLKLFSQPIPDEVESFTENIVKRKSDNKVNDAQLLDRKLESLDQKVSNIDSKLVGLKNQIDNNFLPVDDINAEASEKKPINLNVLEIAKGLNTEVIKTITKEVDQLRTSMSTVDRKLQFHINLVSENLGKVLYMMADVHAAIVEPDAASINVNSLFKNRTATSTQSPITKGSKIDTLVNKIIPMMSVSEKMDEVWDVVVGTKSSVDDLVPKSDELLTQTQRQERAIGQIHNDLRVKTNLIIENLDMVEKRLKKQEDDVATLAQRPVPAELLLDPTIDRLVEYAPNRYRYDEPSTDPNTSTVAATTPSTSSSTIYNSLNNPSSPSGSSTPVSMSASSSNVSGNNGTSSSGPRLASRKGGIIFPSVKNKPIIGNNTFASEIVANYKDVKGFSCVDLLNGGMRESGVYYLQIRGTSYWFLKVFCEQNVADGGWTVIHRRDDYGVPAENFNRDWSDYKNGFGDPNKEFWLGNENIYMLTNNDDYMLRVELEDFDGNKRYAQYSHFKIYSEAEYYKLEIDGYEGNAGDSLNDPWYGSNNSPFSTYNRDNDRSSLNCASMLKGGWWWKSCGRGLNGLYLHDPQDLTARQGIVWFRWRGWDYTLKRASMMIKPRGLQPNT